MKLNLTAKFCSDCGTPVGQATGSAEYKQVTVLFADVVHSMGIAAAYNFDRGGRVRLDPRHDGRVPELMVERLNDTFTRITGRAPAHPNRLPGNEDFGQT